MSASSPPYGLEQSDIIASNSCDRSLAFVAETAVEPSFD